MSDLTPLLHPRSIAILGASADLSKINGRPLKFLLQKSYAGRIYPVNPKYPEIAGIKCYARVADLPEPVDLAIVAVPAKLVVNSIRELGAAGAKSAVIFSSGFGEMGEQGRRAQVEVRAAAQTAGIRICGPNCLGLVNAFENVIATFGQYADGPTPAGPVGFVTQSGAFGTAIAALARRRGLGLGYFINTGNEADVDFVQVMREVLADPRIRVGAGYLEGLKDGEGLTALAGKALEQGKPLVVTKVGKTEAGARAAASHTGSLAGADKVFDDVIRGAGIIRARNEEQMLDMVEVLASCPVPRGRGIGIITQSGGAGVLMADRAEELGLEVPTLGAETQRALKAVIPGFGTSGNPVDVTGQFVSEPALLRESVHIVLSDPAVDIAIVWLQLMDTHVETLLAIFDEIKAKAEKPWIVCWVAAPDAALAGLRARGIAVLRGAEPAVDAVAALVRFAEARRSMLAEASAQRVLTLPQVRLPSPSTGEGQGGGDAAARAETVPSLDARRLLEEAGVATVPTKLAATTDDAVAAAGDLGYPVALKIESPDILHKTEAQGLKLGLKDAQAVRSAFDAVMQNARRYKADARIDGVLVQPMADGDVELVIGLQQDPVFGVVVMVGLGGIHVEVLKDVVFRKAPVSAAEAKRMLDELKSRALLDAVRGRAAVDRDAIADMVSAVSRFGAAAGPRLRELDLNPVLCSARGTVAVDWLLMLD